MGEVWVRAWSLGCKRLECGGFPKLGVPFWGSQNKDYSILGSILGSPYFGNLPCLLGCTAGGDAEL